MSIRLGVIGSSSGNGHPYSWSAIFNGYDKKNMEKCGFPAIPNYLSKQNWPEAQLDSAKVVSIWTQDIENSEHIAKSTYINNVSKSLAEMNKSVDAVLLARDDAENHMDIARIFLLSGKPIYIDKPIALSRKKLDDIYKLQQYEGQIFTCSALRYSNNLILSKKDRLKIGNIVSISASSPNSWDKYAIHLIEPLLNIIPNDDFPLRIKKTKTDSEAVTLNIDWKSGIHSELSTLGPVESKIKITVIGTKSSKELVFEDPFDAFKSALNDFIYGIINQECRSRFEFNLRAVSLIEEGLK